MDIFWLPLLVAIVGLLVYILAANPKASELGRLMFFCGVLVVTLAYGGHALGVGDTHERR